MEGIVDTALGFCRRQAPVQGRLGAIVVELLGKVDDGGGAAKGRRLVPVSKVSQV
jgi:hypothetical protein